MADFSFSFLDSARAALNESQLEIILFYFYTGPLFSPAIHSLVETGHFSTSVFQTTFF